MGFTQRLKLEGETKNMCVWTKKRGSMNAVVLMATPCLSVGYLGSDVIESPEAGDAIFSR